MRKVRTVSALSAIVILSFPGCGRQPSRTNDAPGAQRAAVEARHESRGVPVGQPMSLREAYPDYRPGAGDPEADAVVRGRRDVPVNDRTLDIGGAPSLDDLLTLVVSGIDAADGPALEKTAITRNDFERILWPEFPQSRPAAGVPAAEAWDFVHRQHMASFNRTTGELHGRGLRIASMTVGKVLRYSNFTLHDDIAVTLVDAAGNAIPFDMVRTVVECRGRFKLYATRD